MQGQLQQQKQVCHSFAIKGTSTANALSAVVFHTRCYKNNFKWLQKSGEAKQNFFGICAAASIWIDARLHTSLVTYCPCRLLAGSLSKCAPIKLCCFSLCFQGSSGNAYAFSSVVGFLERRSKLTHVSWYTITYEQFHNACINIFCVACVTKWVVTYHPREVACNLVLH